MQRNAANIEEIIWRRRDTVAVGIAIRMALCVLTLRRCAPKTTRIVPYYGAKHNPGVRLGNDSACPPRRWRTENASVRQQASRGCLLRQREYVHSVAAAHRIHLGSHADSLRIDPAAAGRNG